MRTLAAPFLMVAGLVHAAPDLAQVEDLIEQGTNKFRVEQQVQRVRTDAALERAARGFADFMARTDKYGHEADGAQPAERARRAGYDYCLVSENIAYYFSTDTLETPELGRLYVEGWQRSPGHRKNMLEPGSTDTGVAVARSARTGRYYAVQMFGRPKSRALEFRVTNTSSRAVGYRIDGSGYSVSPRQVRSHRICTAEDVAFPEAENGKGRTIRPSNGDNLVVRGDTRLTVRAERY